MANTSELKSTLSLNTSPFKGELAGAVAAGSAAGRKLGAALQNVGTGPMKFLSGQIKGFVTGPLIGLAAAAGAALGGKAIYGGIRGVWEMGVGIQRLADRTGVAKGILANLAPLFGAAGLEADSVAGAVGRMQKGIAENSSAFGKLGLNLANLSKLNPGQQFIETGKAIAAIQDPAQRTAAAMSIFGKSGAELLGVFRNPAFANAGTSLSPKAAVLTANAQTFFEASRALAKAGGMFKGLYIGLAAGITASILPILTKLGKVDLLGVGLSLGKGLADGIKTFVGALAYPKALLWTMGQQYLANMLQAGNYLAAGMKFGGQTLLAYFQALPNILDNVAEGFGHSLAAGALTLGSWLFKGAQQATAALLAGIQLVGQVGVAGLTKKLLEAALSFVGAMASALIGNAGAIGQLLTALNSSNKVGATAFADLYKTALDSVALGFGDALEKNAASSAAAAKKSFSAALSAASGVQLPAFKVSDVTGAGAYQARAAAGMAGLQRAGAYVLGGLGGSGTSPGAAAGVAASASGPNAIAPGYNPTGSPNWLAAQANQAMAANAAQIAGNGVGGLSTLAYRPNANTTDAGWGRGGLGPATATFTNRAFNNASSAKSQASNGGKGDNVVSAPDVTAKLDELLRQWQN